MLQGGAKSETKIKNLPENGQDAYTVYCVFVLVFNLGSRFISLDGTCINIAKLSFWQVQQNRLESRTQLTELVIYYWKIK